MQSMFLVGYIPHFLAVPVRGVAEGRERDSQSFRGKASWLSRLSLAVCLLTGRPGPGSSAGGSESSTEREDSQLRILPPPILSEPSP